MWWYISGKNAEDHLHNLKQLLQRLSENSLRCRKEKCEFTKPSVEYLGHILSQSKGFKVVQSWTCQHPKMCLHYNLHKLLRNNVFWKWGSVEAKAFNKLKELFSSDSLLVYFDPMFPLGIACDASCIGIGATLFHRYPNGDEKPIANISKLLSASQRKSIQVQLVV